jgi:energy-coupling factor transporter ATP-binding protein EcfA2
MRIDRIEVSGGFLDGMGLTFKDGLNVLIGPRGAGKTSILELLRFALGVNAITPDAEEAAQKQARAVLGDGTVSVYTSVQKEPLIFTRTGLDETPSASASFTYNAPLFVSQNEIEAIGLDPSSRRGILDRLVDPVAWSAVDTAASRAAIASLERRLERLQKERDEFIETAEQSEGLNTALTEAEKEQKSVAAKAKKVTALQKKLAKLADDLGQVRAATDAYKIAEEVIDDWREELTDSEMDRPIPELSSAAVEAQVTKRLSNVRGFLEKATRELDDVKKTVAKERALNRAKQTKMQKQLKSDSERLEAMQQGAGEISRRVSALRQQLKAQEGTLRRIKQLEKEITQVVRKRDSALDGSEKIAESRYQLRKDCATELTSQFKGRIEVRVNKSGELAAYEAALVEILQGSNLRSKTLAAKLAQRVSPRELVAAVETTDAEHLAAAGDISQERAVRLIAHLQSQSIAGLLLAPLDDSVDFALLDGKDYKPTRKLSMGQRCTVVLPLLLAEDRESILLDQPEDHLDNAFIVETLVKAIRDRAHEGQVIVATHNANIPVLGEAQQVIVLASDGRRGFVSTVDELDADDSVDAITTLMEGGREAFARRAAFYSAHTHE